MTCKSLTSSAFKQFLLLINSSSVIVNILLQQYVITFFVLKMFSGLRNRREYGKYIYATFTVVKNLTNVFTVPKVLLSGQEICGVTLKLKERQTVQMNSM